METKRVRRTEQIQTNILSADCEVHIFAMLQPFPTLFGLQRVCKRWQYAIQTLVTKHITFESKPRVKDTRVLRVLNTWKCLESIDLSSCDKISNKLISQIPQLCPQLSHLMLHR